MNDIISKLTAKIDALKQTNVSFPVADWNFFKDDLDNEWVICYVCNNSVNNLFFINSFILPESKSPKKCNEKLIGADFSTVQGWVLFGNGRIDSPLVGRTSPLDKGEPLYFSRHFQGYPRGKENYFEMNQKLTTTLGLHWIEARNAFCTLNVIGDLVPQILLYNTDELTCVLMKRNILDKFLSITNTILIRCFEYRQTENAITDSMKQEEDKSISDVNFCYKSYCFKVNGVTKGLYIRGYNLVTKMKNFVQLEQDECEAEKGKCLDFTIKDIRHGGETIQIDLKQENLASYFQPTSDKPWETSPVFFKANVLQKYKDNPDRYDLTERTINCRGGWDLQTFDINPEGQVHTMAIYLTYLPFEELCHWRSYNEVPKGDISKRSFDTDFLAKLSDQPEPINELKKILRQLWETNIYPENAPLWFPHNGNFEQTFFGFYYVLSDNYNEWQNFIQDLARIVNEGLCPQTIKKIAERLDCNEKGLGSVQLLKKCLSALKIDQETMSQIINPLVELQGARSDMTKAHRPRREMPTLDKLKDDAIERLKKVTNSINCLVKLCAEGKLSEHAK